MLGDVGRCWVFQIVWVVPRMFQVLLGYYGGGPLFFLRMFQVVPYCFKDISGCCDDVPGFSMLFQGSSKMCQDVPGCSDVFQDVPATLIDQL